MLLPEPFTQSRTLNLTPCTQKKLLRSRAFSISQRQLQLFLCNMFKNILEKSIQAMSNDNKIIRRTWITSFFHSLIAILLIVININNLLAKNYKNGLYIGKVAQYFVEEVGKNNFTAIIIAVTIALFLAYSIIYPIGQSAIIHYLHNKKETMKQSLRRARSDFFPMFEFGFIAVVLSPIVWILVAFKLLILDGYRTGSTIMLLIIRFILINILNNLKAYTRYLITIEKKQLYEALKGSFTMALRNRKNTFRYMRVQTILLINFSFNLLVILGIPFLIIYGAISRDIIQYDIVKILVYISFLVMVLLGSYISAIIRAFFAYYRYEIYNITKKHGK